MEPSKDKPQMEYRHLGGTGLKVSVLGYGCSSLTDQELITKNVAKCYELGINFFDCAENYGGKTGLVETCMGNAIKALNADREDLVITTKLFFKGETPLPNQVNRTGLSRKHLIEGAKASLKRMQLDYVDIILAHRFDVSTPMEETCRAFDWLVRHGYALYWGTSSWPAQMIEEAIKVCETLRLVKPVCEQPEYNILSRELFEKEYYRIFKNYKYGSTIYSPMAAGVLTGKYNAEIPEDSRMMNPERNFAVKKFLDDQKIEETRKKTIQLDNIAKEIGCTCGQLALAWALKNKDVSTAIIGASKTSQIEDTVGAVRFVSKITPEIEDRIDEIFGNRPDIGIDFKARQPLINRRKL